ncbi:unnamed protein product [Choristocarpus tenellus]
MMRVLSTVSLVLFLSTCWLCSYVTLPSPRHMLEKVQIWLALENGVIDVQPKPLLSTPWTGNAELSTNRRSLHIVKDGANLLKKIKSPMGVLVDPKNVTESVSLQDLEAPPGKLWLPVSVGKSNGKRGEGRRGRAFDNILVAYCLMDMDAYHEKPWAFAMGTSLQRRSGCNRNKDLTRTYRLNSLMDILEDHPSSFLDPTGFIYHQTRCGSTLTANMLAAVPTNIVHSETPPPVSVLNLCKKSCSEEDRSIFLRTILRLMSPAQNGHSHSFFKFQSSKYVKEVEAAWPSVKWVYLFRDPLEVMASNLKGAWRRQIEPKRTIVRGGPIRAQQNQKLEDMGYNMAGPCLRGLKDRGPIGNRSQTKEVSSPREVAHYCAKHLQSLNVLALHQIQGGSPNGLVVEYSQLPEALIDYIYPVHFGMEEDGSHKADYPKWMEPVSHYYSKGMGKGDFSEMTKEFSQGMDLEMKANGTDTAMQQIAKDVLCSSYQSLQKLEVWHKEREGQTMGTCLHKTHEETKS